MAIGASHFVSELMDRAEVSIPVRGKIACQISGFMSSVFECRDLEYEITIEPGHESVRHGENIEGPQYVFSLIGGPTGYESFYIKPLMLRKMFRVGWMACFGTGGYNRCYVPGDERRRHLSLFLEG